MVKFEQRQRWPMFPFDWQKVTWYPDISRNHLKSKRHGDTVPCHMRDWYVCQNLVRMDRKAWNSKSDLDIQKRIGSECKSKYFLAMKWNENVLSKPWSKCIFFFYQGQWDWRPARAHDWVHRAIRQQAGMLLWHQEVLEGNPCTGEERLHPKVRKNFRSSTEILSFER